MTTFKVKKKINNERISDLQKKKTYRGESMLKPDLW